MEVIYRGLRLSSNRCRYYRVKQGTVNSLMEDTSASCLNLTYIPGETSGSLSQTLGIPLVGDPGMRIENGSGKFKTTIVTLNGLRLQKLTHDSHTISIVIVADSESRVIQTYSRTTIVANKNDYNNPEFIKFLFTSGNFLYLRPIGCIPGDYVLKNFPKIIIGDKNLDLTSSSEMIYTLRKRYNDYVIREVDYQDQFILELRNILDNYGIDLVRLNKETSLSRTSYITYQFNQTPSLYSHPKRNEQERGIISHKQPVDFVLHTPDMVMYHDFKSKYSDVLLLTNLTEFKTTDKYGERWSAAVKWGQITEDFSGNNYQQDDNSNFAQQCTFRCELYFYEVLDTRFAFLEEILLELDSLDKNNEIIKEEHDTI